MTNGVSSIFVGYKILKEKQKFYCWSATSYYSFFYLFFFLIYLIFSVKTAHKVKKKQQLRRVCMRVKMEKMLRNLKLKHSIVECVSKSEGEW